MTVLLNNSTPVQTPGNGATVTFNYPWKISAATDLVVGFIVGGTYTQQTSGFTVAGVGLNSGGSITFTTAPPLGTTVDLRTVTPEIQPTEFANLTAYLPENTTSAADRLTRMIQDLARQTYTFGIHGPDQEIIPWTTLPIAAVRANASLGFDANGLPTTLPLIAGSLTQAAFNALLLTTDSGYRYRIHPVETANGLTTSQLTFGFDPGDIRRYGAKGDGVTDDSTAYATAALVCGTLPMLIPYTSGGYKVVTPFVLPANATMIGIGKPLLFATVNGTHICSCVGQSEITLSGIRFSGTNSSTVPLNAFGGYAAFVTGLVTLVNCTGVRVSACESSTFYNCITIQQCTDVFTDRNKVSHWLASGYQWGCNINTVSIGDTADTSDQNGAVVSYCVQATGNAAAGTPTVNNKWISPTWHNCPSWDGLGSHDYDGIHIVDPDIRNVRQGIDLGHLNSSNVCKNATVKGGYILGTPVDTWAGAPASTGGILIEGFDATHRVDGTTVTGTVIDGFFGVTGMVGGGIPSNITVSNADNTAINGPVVKNAGSIVNNGGIFLNGTINQFSASGGSLQGKMLLGGVRFNNVTGNVTSVSGIVITQNSVSDNALVASGSTLSQHSWSGNPTNVTTPILISTSTITYASNGGVIRGSQALAGVTSQAVAFPNGQQMPSSYEVTFSQNATSVSPPWFTSKTATGFTINFSANFTGNVDWVASS